MEDNPWNFPTGKTLVVCKHENLNQTRLKVEVFTCHSKPPELYKCEFYGFETNLKVDLTEHFPIFHEGKEEKELKNIVKCHRCKNCDFETHSVLILMNHTNNCNSLELNKRFLAKVKPKNLRTICANANVLLEHSYSRSLHQHVSTDVTNWLKCVQCDFKFKYIIDLERHFVMQHGNSAVRWFQCEQCEFKCKWQTNLKQHMLIKHTVTNWVKCEQCDFKCKHKNYLKRHFEMKHANPAIIKWFQCKHCEFRCKKHGNLRRHILVTHTEIKWLKCEQCDFECKHKHYLNRHIKSQHWNPALLKWFFCDQCEYKSKQKGNLRYHISVKHVDPKDINWFECGQCDFKYKCKRSLKVHLEVHSLMKHGNSAL